MQQLHPQHHRSLLHISSTVEQRGGTRGSIRLVRIAGARSNGATCAQCRDASVVCHDAIRGADGVSVNHHDLMT